MRFLLCIICSLALVAFASGCQTDDVVAPELDAEATLGSPPAESGIVSRSDDGFGWWWIGADGYTVFFGMEDIAALCTGEPLVWDYLNQQQLATPAGSVHNLFNTMVHVNVYPSIPINCGAVTGTPTVANGIVKLVNPDNDYFVSGPGANAWGFTLTGTVYDDAGVAYDLLVRLQLFIPVGGDLSTPGEVRKAKVQLTLQD